ncbi:threonylcarbamoyl-AMP synthase [Candidatus Woesearchaeota archaeon B3_Woes]|nr:MAG: threonylcarbamoyl-AMP synthase [Candidatus Woesearchaeota archaeon B3_Woes]
MEIINRDEYNLKKDQFLERIEQGAVFIYPTDTIYGIGSSALNQEAVRTIRKAKNRRKMPFSIIAPSKKWIRKNCEVSEEAEKWIRKLPGQFTLILKLKTPNAVDKAVNKRLNTLGVRIPKHWTSEIAKDLDIPIVTTSANVAGREFMTSIDDLDNRIKSKTDFMINVGEIKGKPSKLIDLTKKGFEIKER